MMIRTPATVERLTEVTNLDEGDITLTGDSLAITAEELILQDGFSIGHDDEGIFIGMNDINISSSTTSQTPITSLSQNAGGSITIDSSSIILQSQPTSAPDTYQIRFNTLLRSDRINGVLANDTDQTEDILTANLDTNPSHGQLALQSNGSFTYQPDFGFIGQDSFTYTAFDGALTSDPTTVNIAVIGFPQIKRRSIQGSNRNNTLKGTKRSDYILGAGGDDFINARKGNDTIQGGLGRDYIKGKKGRDLILGGADNDFIKGNKGNDTLFGESGDDYLKGNKGHDLLIGGDGDDYLKGNKGSDTLSGGLGADTLKGGRGKDVYVIGGEKGIDRFEKFKAGKDKIGLANGLTYSSLGFERRNTSVLVSVDNMAMAIIQDVQVSEISQQANFINI